MQNSTFKQSLHIYSKLDLPFNKSCLPLLLDFLFYHWKLFFQAEFGDRAHFNGKSSASRRLSNTCNVSIIGPKYNGKSRECSRQNLNGS